MKRGILLVVLAAAAMFVPMAGYAYREQVFSGQSTFGAAFGIQIPPPTQDAIAYVDVLTFVLFVLVRESPTLKAWLDMFVSSWKAREAGVASMPGIEQGLRDLGRGIERQNGTLERIADKVGATEVKP